MDILYGPSDLGITAEYPTVQSLSQSLAINSNTYYWCSAVSADPHEAVARVMRTSDPLVRLGLYMATGVEVSTAPIQVVNKKTKERVSADSTTASFRPVPTLTDLDASKVIGIVQDLEKSEFEPAIKHLSKGDSLGALETSAGTLAEDAALLEYAKALEYITKGEASERDGDYEQKRDKVVARLHKDMTGSKSPKNLATRIVGAASEINSLERRTVVMRIESFAHRVSMAPSWKQVAIELVKARNTSLAHPGEGLPRSVRERLSGSRKAVVDAIFATLPKDTYSQTLRVQERPAQALSERGPVLNWGAARYKVYAPGGQVEWIQQNDPVKHDGKAD